MLDWSCQPCHTVYPLMPLSSLSLSQDGFVYNKIFTKSNSIFFSSKYNHPVLFLGFRMFYKKFFHLISSAPSCLHFPDSPICKVSNKIMRAANYIQNWNLLPLCAKLCISVTNCNIWSFLDGSRRLSCIQLEVILVK